MSAFLQLPRECVLNVLTRLPLADVVATASCCCGLRQLAADDCFWAGLAEAKWGEAVRELKLKSDQQQAATQTSEAEQAEGADTGREQASLGSWQRYCYKRMSARTIRPSPLNLLQESYPDPWQHITCCVLCSRTSGSGLIRTAIANFFETLPTPTAVLAATDELLQDLLHPLGLQASRMAAVRAVAHDFLATDWSTPAEFHGCGKFVTDSWSIFCRGYRDIKGVADSNLKAYLSWTSRQACSTTAGAAEEAQTQELHPRKQKRKQQQEQGRKAIASAASPQQQQQQQAAPPAVRTRGALKRQCNSQPAAAVVGKTRSSSVLGVCPGGKGPQSLEQQGKVKKRASKRHQQVQQTAVGHVQAL